MTGGPQGLGRLDFCGPFINLMDASGQRMVYWEDGVSKPAKLPVPQIRCIRISVFNPQNAWLIIQQVQVRTL